MFDVDVSDLEFTWHTTFIAGRMPIVISGSSVLYLTARCMDKLQKPGYNLAKWSSRAERVNTAKMWVFEAILYHHQSIYYSHMHSNIALANSDHMKDPDDECLYDATLDRFRPNP